MNSAHSCEASFVIFVFCISANTSSYNFQLAPLWNGRRWHLFDPKICQLHSPEVVEPDFFRCIKVCGLDSLRSSKKAPGVRTLILSGQFLNFWCTILTCATLMSSNPFKTSLIDPSPLSSGRLHVIRRSPFY